MEVLTLSSKDKNKICSAKIYNRKIKENPEFYEAEKKRIVCYQNNRYNTDDEYREKTKKYMREYMKECYQKKKLAKKLEMLVI